MRNSSSRAAVKAAQIRSQEKSSLQMSTVLLYCLQFTSKNTILKPGRKIGKSKEGENMKHTHHRRSDCPINFALEIFGDPWSLLIIRDIVYFGKSTYGEFLASEEGMATNILASRLAHLEHQGILVKKFSQQDKRKEEYVLTEKGLDLIPVLVEMANWSAEHDPHTAAPAAWIALMKAEGEKMVRLMRETVQSGGAVFVSARGLAGT